MNYLLPNKKWIVLFATLSLALFACGDSGESNNGNNGNNGTNNGSNNGGECVKVPPTDPNAHACWHACKGDSVEVEPVLDPSAETPPTVMRGPLHPVTLPENTDGQYEGYVLYDAPIGPDSTKNIFVHTVSQVPVEARLNQDGSDTIAANQAEFDCEYGLAWSNDMPMEDETYLIHFGPTDSADITFQIVPENGPYMPEGN
jgi:hypothetical protein